MLTRATAIFLVVCGVLHVHAALFDKTQKVMSVKRMKMCKGAETLPLQWYDVVIRRDRVANELTMGLRLVITRAITGVFSMEFNFLKCDLSGNLGSCEYVVKGYKNKDICQYMVAKDQPWTPWMQSFDKPLVCPMQPGVYKSTNAALKSELLKRLPLPEGMWKVRMKGFEDDKIISCIDVEAVVKKENVS